MPPNSSRVISAVRAPSRAARSAAITPAGPAPTTSTSTVLPDDEAIDTMIESGAQSSSPKSDEARTAMQREDATVRAMTVEPGRNRSAGVAEVQGPNPNHAVDLTA